MKKETLEFLHLFPHDIYTFQSFKNGRPTDAGVVIKEELHRTTFPDDYEHFLMINEGDGIIHPGKKIPRSQDNVIALNALFIDTDDIPISEVKAFLKAHQIKPHLIVETSPKRYHLYIFLDKIDLAPLQPQARGQVIQRWRLAQQTLAHLGEPNPQTDASMKDCSRVLRLPGTYHLKNPKEPFLCQIRRRYTHPNYSLDEILESLGLLQTDMGALGQTQQTSQIQTESYQLKEGMVNKGNRHSEMTAFVGSLVSKGVAPDIIGHAYNDYVSKHFEEPSLFLPDGPRYHEFETFLKWKLEEHANKMHQEALHNANAILESTNEEIDPYQLPETFYLNSPGLLGELTRFIDSTSTYRLPEASFAAAITILSTVKGNNYSLEQPCDSPPCLYLLCLAPTGSGKNHAQTIVHNVMHELELPHKVVASIRSDRGMLVDIEKGEGAKTFVLDEIAGMFSAMHDRNSSSHLKGLRTRFLALYSAYNIDGVDMGSIANKKDPGVILDRPHVTLLGFGVSDMVPEVFNERAITDGLLQRFIIISTNRDRVRNPEPKSFSEFPPNIMKKLEHLAKELPMNGAEHQVIKLSEGARRLYNEFSDEMDSRYNEEKKRHTGLLGLYTRAAEQVGRLCCACADSLLVEEDLMGFMVEFMRSRIVPLAEACAKEFAQSELSRGLEDLLQFIAKNVNDEGVCTYRAIIRSFRVRDSRSLKQLLQDAVESGSLIHHPKYIKGGKAGRPGSAYSLGVID